MKAKYFLLSLLLMASVACSHKKDTTPNPGDGNQTTHPPNDQPLNIEMALMTRPQLVKTHSSDPVIINKLIDYFNHAPESSVVHISIYGFNHIPPLEEAVENAYERGVEIHMMIDSSIQDSRVANMQTISEFRSLLNDPSELITVNNDITTTSINHEKYVLFSEVDLPEGVAKNVVFATSQNFVQSATEKVQDAVVMSNKSLYNAFLVNWESVASLAHSGMGQFEYQVFQVGDSIDAIFFPRRKNGKWDGFDTILEQLDSLSEYSKDTVCVFMANWSRVAIAEKLTDLQKRGVSVQVIARKAGQGSSDAVISELHKLKDAGGYVKILDITKESNHSKCMLIKGVFNGKEQQIILTGSHNYTQNALKYNNEFLLKLKNSTLFPVYWSYFKDLKTTLDDFSGW